MSGDVIDAETLHTFAEWASITGHATRTARKRRLWRAVKITSLVLVGLIVGLAVLGAIVGPQSGTHATMPVPAVHTVGATSQTPVCPSGGTGGWTWHADTYGAAVTCSAMITIGKITVEYVQNSDGTTFADIWDATTHTCTNAGFDRSTVPPDGWFTDVDC